MRRLIYLCPETDLPVGGIKVIYRHVEALNRIGIPAFVLHPHTPTFRCGWFQHDVPFLDGLVLDPILDFVIIPEVWTLLFGPQCQALDLRYAIFVQNGYIVYPLRDEDAEPLSQVMLGADLLLSISAETDQIIHLNFPTLDPARIVRVASSIPDRFAGRPVSTTSGDDGGLISYMPRKLASHARRVVYALRNHLPAGWHIQAIDNVDEATCAAMLLSSRIFLAFSELEGLALPPLEAALAGNVVIGHTGHGGAELWEAPNFQVIEQGDVIGFVRAALAAARQMDAGAFGHAVLQPGQMRLATRFSIAAETDSLRRMAARIAACCGIARM